MSTCLPRVGARCSVLVWGLRCPSSGLEVVSKMSLLLPEDPADYHWILATSGFWPSQKWEWDRSPLDLVLRLLAPWGSDQGIPFVPSWHNRRMTNMYDCHTTASYRGEEQ